MAPVVIGLLAGAVIMLIFLVGRLAAKLRRVECIVDQFEEDLSELQLERWLAGLAD